MSLFPTVGTEKKGGKMCYLLLYTFIFVIYLLALFTKNKIKSVLFGVTYLYTKKLLRSLIIF